MENTILLLHCEDFKDDSPNKNTVTNYNTNIVTGGKFDKGISLQENQYILTDATIDLSKDFTIDWWEYSTGKTSSDKALCINRNSIPLNHAQGMLIGYNGIGLYTGSGTGSWNGFNSVTIKDKVDNVWVHWALVKQGSKWTTYKNGVQFWSATSSVTPAFDAGFVIGGWTTNQTINYSGYNAIIDEFRISNIARWTNNFEVSTEPYKSTPILAISEQTKSNIKFSALYDGTINKVDVLVNEHKLKSYTSNFNDLNFDIDANNSAYKKGENKIKILVTYDTSKTIEKTIIHNIYIMNNASLKDVMDEFEKISLIELSSIDVVTATSLPNSVKNGRIVAITDIKPNKIVFNYEPTDDLEEGDLFIKYYNTSKSKFTTKGNIVINLDIYGVTQMRDGVLKKIDSFIGSNDTWKPMTEVYLFDNGDKTEITGGYSVTKYEGSVELDTAIRLNVNSGGGAYSSAISKKSISVGGFNRLNFEFWSSFNGYSTELRVGFPQASKQYSKTMSTGTVKDQFGSLDISDLTGEHNLELTAYNNGGNGGSIVITKIWLE